MGRQALGTHGKPGNVFADPVASSSAPSPQEMNPWGSSIEEPLLSSTVEKSERRRQDQDQRCQSGPSARNSVIPSEGDSSNNYGADQRRLQISELHFDKFPTPATFACWKIRFKTEVCICSQFPTEATLWIKEVELVESVDDLKSSRSVGGIRMPDFEVLDAKIASALNRIIHNSHFKRRVGLEEHKAPKEDRFLRGRQIAYLIYEYFRVTGSQRFCRELCRPIYYCSSKWWHSGIRFEVGRNFIVYDENPIWWHLGRIVQTKNTRVWETQNSIGIVWTQKKLGPDYHRLKTMVKRSIEQDIRNKNFEARNGNYERNAVVKNQGTEQRGKRTLGDCWQWETNGQCVKGDNCSFRHDTNKRGKLHNQIRLRILSCSRVSENHREPEVPEAEVPAVERLDGPARITLEELAPIHSVKSGALQNACSTRPRVVVGLEKSAHTHIVRLMNNLAISPKNDDKSTVDMLKKYELHVRTGQPVVGRDNRHESTHGPVVCNSSNTRQLGCLFQHMEWPKLPSILRKSSDMQKPIQRVKLTKAIARRTKIRDQNLPLGYICPGEPHQRSSNAPKFEDRFQEETEWQEQGVGEAAWKLAKNVLKLKEHERATFFSPFGK